MEQKTLLLLLLLNITLAQQETNKFNGVGNLAIDGAVRNTADGNYNTFDGNDNNAKGNKNSFVGDLNEAKGDKNNIAGVIN